MIQRGSHVGWCGWALVCLAAVGCGRSPADLAPGLSIAGPAAEGQPAEKTMAPTPTPILTPVKVALRPEPTQPAAPRSVPPVRARNILLIYTDDQTARSLSCYEGTPAWVSTPNLDQLAAEGMRFTHCYGAPSCMISRLMMLTGLHPHAIQGMSAGKPTTYDPQRCRFWPAQLRQAGYGTALIGKWHLGDDVGHGREWEHSVVWIQPAGLSTPRRPYQNPELLLDGQPAQPVTGYSTDLYTQYAVEYVRRAHDRPWFLWLCYNAPHGPREPHPRHQDRYRDAPARTPVVSTPVARYLFPDPATFAESFRNYHRLVCAIDEGVGAIRKALAETGQLDNTLIVFTSDNGLGFGEHGIDGKLVAYDVHMRVPLIVRFPAAVSAGTVCRTPVGILDLPPTCLALAGQPLPWEMHGHDLRPLLANPQTPWSHPVVLENFYLQFGSQTDGGCTTEGTLNGIPWWLTLIDHQHQYIRSLVHDAVEEFYDHTKDRRELRNLALEPEHAEKLARYRQQLLDELQRTGAAFISRLPPPRAYPDDDEP